MAAQALAPTCERGTGRAVLWDCAEHWALAGEPEKAYTLFEQLSNRRMRSASFGVAETLSRALQLNLPTEQRIALARQNCACCGVRWRVGDGTQHRSYDAFAWATTHHDDVELAELRALSSPYGMAIVGSRLIACMRCQEATPTHCVTAAIQALKFADLHGRPTLIVDVFDNLGERHLEMVNAPLRLEYLTVAAVVTERYAEAGERARLQLVSQHPRTADPHLGTRLINAALVLTLAARDNDALRVLDLCLAESTRQRLENLRLRTPALKRVDPHR